MAPPKPSIAFIMPAYNEESSLVDSVESVLAAVNNLALDYEIIIINDASKDTTGAVAESLSLNNPKIRVFHNDTNIGFGGSFKRGTEEARTEHLLMVPADNDFAAFELRKLLENLGQADFVEHYPANPEIRPLGRRIISFLFVKAMNFFFSLDLPYYTGITIYRKRDLETIPWKEQDFTFSVQILVRGIKQGRSFRGVALNISPRKFGKSNLFRSKHVIPCLLSVVYFWCDIMFLSRLRSKPLHQ
jgi:glycosyltransferase involved in cell wall biosynthesis